MPLRTRMSLRVWLRLRRNLCVCSNACVRPRVGAGLRILIVQNALRGMDGGVNSISN